MNAGELTIPSPIANCHRRKQAAEGMDEKTSDRSMLIPIYHVIIIPVILT